MKKLSALEAAEIQPPVSPVAAAPCALLAGHTPPQPEEPPAAPDKPLPHPVPQQPPAPVEDESADPVGDGHSDADFARRQPPAPPP
jgi:hypothetical protein